MPLTRFHDAQKRTLSAALSELRAGHKASHWMWWIFPQLRALGRSATAQRYGLADMAEARAYLADPVLHRNLTEAARTLLAHRGKSAEAILGPVDAMKLRSSATLFREAGGGPEFQALLEAFHGGKACPLTLAALKGDSPRP